MSADLVLVLGLVLLCLIMCPAVQGEGGGGKRRVNHGAERPYRANRHDYDCQGLLV